jgi:hypothetical protein
MRQHSAYAVGALGTAVASVCFLAALEISVATTSPVASAPLSAPASDVINRAHKGNRLEIIPLPNAAVPSETPVPRAPARQLPDGCESAFSSISRSPAPALTGHCVT